MQTLSESVRKATTFLLGAFFWLHALLFLNFQTPFISKSAQFLQLTISEVVLFTLLVIFSFLTASGFWRTLLSLLYIYAFPFVVLVYGFYWCFLLLRAVHRWLRSQTNLQPDNATVETKALTLVPEPTASVENRVETRKRAEELLQFLVRPFQRFTFLWCALLLVTTHRALLWLCLIVVLLHLARKVFVLLKILFFLDPWLRKIGKALLTPLEQILAGLDAVTPETMPTKELKNLWSQFGVWQKIIDFLKDRYLVSRWAWVLGILFMASIYTYIAVLFSFGYYGIARVNGVSYSWPEALVTSTFILIFVKELPKILAIKVLAGLHWLLVFGISIGTIVNFFRRQVDSIRETATELSDRMDERKTREKYLILEAKFSTTPSDTGPTKKSQ
jgi:hypothetical protein